MAQSLLLIDRLPDHSSRTAQPEGSESLFHLRLAKLNSEENRGTAITEPYIFYPCQTIAPVSSKPLNQRKREEMLNIHLTTKSNVSFLYVVVSLHDLFAKWIFSTGCNKPPWPTEI